ncbi:hypothetical protein [Tengunoibacter tsumagoiensis]|uniref:Uncharacterized protein n=1 Tax=Tengunoibacter tsumagoiensis TaxID=2014871 RepID=A0A401ZWV4_9CHLR|nr:hypothetical protein [Tengunoibacter tsumagoiensis]GCE11286.1 hypothetical protein KTT_11450 [Tengunoibacter tsumagoiensis]
MSNWLQNHTSPVKNTLNTIWNKLKDLQNEFFKYNDDYYVKSQDVANHYQGASAVAFLDAVGTDINKAKSHLEHLGHVSSASSVLSSAITNTSQSYDGKLDGIINESKYEVPQNVFDSWRDALINGVLQADGTQQTFLNDVLTTGSTIITQKWSAVYNDSAAWITLAADSIVLDAVTYDNPWADTNSKDTQKLEKDLEGKFTNSFDNLAQEIEKHLKDWADEIHSAYTTFQGVMNNPDYLSARDLFYYIGSPRDHTQNTNKPITITPYTNKEGQKGLLITIAGTDISHWWDTSLFTALQTGVGAPDNPYLTEIGNAINTYMSQHPEMNGADVTFAGYSLGGMAAQDWASEIMDTSKTNQLSQYHLHVANVVTYGAPVMHSPDAHVNYQMYDANHDPIPLLSSYENPQLSDKHLVDIVNQLVKNPLGVNVWDILNNSDRIETAYQSLQKADTLPWDKKLSSYIDTKHEYQDNLHAIHDLTDIGNIDDGNKETFHVDYVWEMTQNGFQQVPVFIPGHSLNFENHTKYTISNQLNMSSTDTTGIDPQTFGPTEYFGLYTHQ